MSEPGALGRKEESMTKVLTMLSDLSAEVLKLRQECESAFQGLNARQEKSEKTITTLNEASAATQASIQSLQNPIGQPNPQSLEVPPAINPHSGKAPTASLTPLPKKYAGEPKEFDNFVVQCQLQFRVRPAVFHTDEQKVNFMLMLLEGRALQWAAPLIKRDAAVLHDYTAFLHLITNVFENKYHAHTRKQEFLNIQQGRHDLVSYIAYFQSLASEVDWSEDTQVALFHKGLREDIKDAISGVHPLPDTLHEVFDLCLRVNHRLKERKGGAKGTYTLPPLQISSVNRGEPMVLGEITEKNIEGQEVPKEAEVLGELRGPLTEAERKRRRELRLCFYCGKPGHSINQCHLKTPSGNECTLKDGRP